MVNILVRDVPAPVHARLVAKAEAAGQSLQQYLAGELTRLALQSRSRLTPAEMIEATRGLREAVSARMRETGQTVTAQDVADMIRADRGDDLEEYGPLHG